MSLDVTSLTLEQLPATARTRLEKAASKLGTGIEVVFESFKQWLMNNVKILESYYRSCRSLERALVLATNAFIVQILRKRPGTSRISCLVVGAGPIFPTKKDPTSRFTRLLVITRDEQDVPKFEVAIVKGMNVGNVIEQLEPFQMYEIEVIRLRTGGYLVDDSAEVKLISTDWSDFFHEDEKTMIEEIRRSLLDVLRNMYEDTYDEVMLSEPCAKLSIIYYVFALKNLEPKLIYVSQACKYLSKTIDESAGWIDPTDLRIVRGIVARKNKTIVKGCETLIMEISDVESCLQEVTVGEEGVDASLNTLTIWANPVFDRYGRGTDAFFIGTINMSRKTNLPMMSLYTMIPIAEVAPEV